MKRISIALIAVFSVAVIIVSCKEEAKKGAKKEIKTEKQDIHNHDNDMANAAYQCPMDCEHGKTYDKEGNCPVCNMKLKKVASKDVDSTKVSSNMNYKNCFKSCKGKLDCKNMANCKDKASCKGKADCKDKANCKDKADCKDKASCKGNTDSANKMCSKCQTKNCKGACKGKA